MSSRGASRWTLHTPWHRRSHPVRPGCTTMCADVAEPVRAAYERYGIPLGALVVLPLQSSSDLVGGLTLAWSRPRRFSDEDMEFDLSVGRAFATALENARLFGVEKRQSAIEEGINKILHAALDARTDEELGAVCLEVAVEVTDSAFGFIEEIADDGRLHDISMTNPGWEACTMKDKSGHRRTPGAFAVHGLYGRVFVDGETLCTNAPGSHPDSVGTPEGHPGLTAFLGVPLLNEGRAFGLIAVANRKGGYTQEHVRALEAVSRVVVEAFQRMRAERELAVATPNASTHTSATRRSPSSSSTRSSA